MWKTIAYSLAAITLAAALIAAAMTVLPDFGPQAAVRIPAARSVTPAACAQRGWPYAWCTDSQLSSLRLITTGRLR